MTPGASREDPLIRPPARILLLDESDRTLLFTAMTPMKKQAFPSTSRRAGSAPLKQRTAAVAR